MEKISRSYIEKQTAYLNSLSDEEKYIINLYTIINSINAFIRNGFAIDRDVATHNEMADRFCKNPDELNKCFMYYYQKLQNVILNAPKTEERIVLYRGVQSIEYYKTKEKFHKNTGFMSTSLDFNIAKMFSFGGGYVIKIIVPIGFHLLVLGSLNSYIESVEVLLPNDTTFYIKKDFRFNSEFGVKMAEIMLVSEPTNVDVSESQFKGEMPDFSNVSAYTEQLAKFVIEDEKSSTVDVVIDNLTEEDFKQFETIDEINNLTISNSNLNKKLISNLRRLNIKKLRLHDITFEDNSYKYLKCYELILHNNMNHDKISEIKTKILKLIEFDLSFFEFNFSTEIYIFNKCNNYPNIITEEKPIELSMIECDIENLDFLEFVSVKSLIIENCINLRDLEIIESFESLRYFRLINEGTNLEQYTKQKLIDMLKSLGNLEQVDIVNNGVRITLNDF